MSNSTRLDYSSDCPLNENCVLDKKFEEHDELETYRHIIEDYDMSFSTDSVVKVDDNTTYYDLKGIISRIRNMEIENSEKTKLLDNIYKSINCQIEKLEEIKEFLFEV